jgi:hypothetical protein
MEAGKNGVGIPHWGIGRRERERSELRELEVEHRRK